MYEPRSATQVYALTLGIALLTIGLVGFVAKLVVASGGAPFGVETRVTVFFLDPWRSGLHLLAGLLGLATWRRADSARVYALAVGTIYLAAAIWGFAPGPHPVAGLTEARVADSVAHALVGATGLTLGLLARRRPSARAAQQPTEST